MNRFFRKYIKRAKRVSLPKEEKQLAREQVRLFVQDHPMPEVGRVWHRPTVFLSTSFFWVYRRPLAVALTVVVLIVTSGGVVFAAEESLPGDVLYPIKINVTEEVRAAMIPTKTARANWEITRVERRLNEVETLARLGRLDATTSQRIAEGFAVRADAANATVIHLETGESLKEADEVGMRLAETLVKHGKILQTLQDNTSRKVALQPIIDRLKKKTVAVAQVRARAQAKVAEVHAVQLKKRIDMEMHKVEDEVARMDVATGTFLGTTTSEAVVADLDILMHTAKEKNEAGAYQASLDTLKHARELLRETRALERKNPREERISPTHVIDASSSVRMEVSRPTGTASGIRTRLFDAGRRRR